MKHAKEKINCFRGLLFMVLKLRRQTIITKEATAEILIVPSVNCHLNLLKTKSHPTLVLVVGKVEIQENTANIGTSYVF